MPLTFRFVPADRRGPLLAAAGDDAAAAVAGQGAADARDAGARRSTSRSTPACWPRRLPAASRRRRRVTGTAAGRLDPAAIAVLLGFLGAARPARQGLVPRLPGRRSTRRCCWSSCSRSHNLIVACAVRLLLHLVGRRVLEAEPPLPVRGLGDDQQHAVEPLAQRQGASSTATTPRTCGRRGRPRLAAHLGTVDGVRPAARPARLRAAARSARSRWSG